MKKTYEVYVITNSKNGKKYVGVTTRGYPNRFANHLWHSRKNSGNCSALYSAIRKHGADCFSVELVEQCSSFEEMNSRERYWIKSFNTMSPSGYNLTDGGDAGVFVESTRMKMSQRLKGLPMSEKNKEGLRNAWSNPEVRASRIEKIKEAMARPEVREATGARQRGVKKTPEHVASLRKARARKVTCVDTGEQFEAIADAVQWVRSQGKYPKANHSKIIRATKREDYTAYGYRWKLSC